MSINETNASIKTSSRLKKQEEIESILSQPFNMVNALKYMNILQWAYDDSVSTSEMKFDRLMKHSTDDRIMQNLYNGVFDRNIFNQMSEAATYDMFNELTQVNLSKLYLNNAGAQKILGNANLGNMKVNTFVKLLQDKLGLVEMEKLIDQWNPSAENVGLQKMFAMAENEIP